MLHDLSSPSARLPSAVGSVGELWAQRCFGNAASNKSLEFIFIAAWIDKVLSDIHWQGDSW